MFRNIGLVKIAFIIFLLNAFNVYAANISVSTDRDPVSINDSFQIIFEADGTVDGDPDFSPLNKDFKVLSTSVSSNMSIINGAISSTKQWQLTVLARRTGEVRIPSVSFGKDRSPVATVNISTSTSSNIPRNEGDIFLSVAIDPENIYVQSQVIYTIKLFRSVNTTNASLSDPEVAGGDAVIEQVGEDKSYETAVKGKRYLVVERRFAIYPQVSGKLTIAPIRFQGQIASNTFSLFDPFGPQPKAVIRQSEPIVLNVLEIPQSFKANHWLPSKKVTLEEDWSENPPVFRVGEPVTRTVRIWAEGQTSSQLPELPRWELPGFKQYPDQAILNDSKTRTGITGSRQEKVAVIPSQTGQYTIPEMRIPWWNTDTNSIETSVLPARKISVLPGLNAVNQPGPVISPSLGQGPVIDEPVATVNKNAITGGMTNTKASADSLYMWQWISLCLCLAWITTLWLWWNARQQGIKNKQAGNTGYGIKQAFSQVKVACGNNDAHAAKQALLQWARLNWNIDPPLSIGDIAKRCSEEFARELFKLNTVLYSKDKASWTGNDLWQLFSREQQPGKNNKQESGKLEPLYRIT